MQSLDKIKTLPELVTLVINSYNNPSFLNYRVNDQWESVSVESFLKTVRQLTLGFKHMGVQPGDGFGILADPSPHWVMVDLAIQASGAVSVPMFANISPENLKFEIADSKMRFLFVDTADKMEVVKERRSAFAAIVTQSEEKRDGNVIHFDQALALGDKQGEDGPELFAEMREGCDENDVATIIYTSGSTGVPKGVEITHKNLISQIRGCHERFPVDPATDIMLTCLPLAHVFERMVIYFYLSSGAKIYFADDVKNVGNLLRDVHPTMITLVPRLLEKVFDKMSANVAQAHGIKKLLGKAALGRAARRDPEKDRRGLMDILFDRLVYGKLRAALGGNIVRAISGAAPLSKQLGNFFVNIGIPIFEGYGLTETSPVLCANYENNRKLGTVGKAFPGVEIRIGDGGEILARGPNIMKGYHHNEEATKATIDEEGWLHTGDQGEMDADGFLKITGRIKELYKTSTGKYVSPVPIEQALSGHELIDMAMVIAEGRKFVTCLLFPNFETTTVAKDARGFGNMQDNDFLKSSYALREFENLIERVNAGLNHWEQVRKYRIVSEPLSIAAGDLTPTMKIRRHAIDEKYKALIDEMYEDEA